MAELDERIRQAEARLKQLKAQKQQVEARKRALESKKLRAADTRRKILVGSAILAKVERGEWPRDRLLNLMDETLIRSDDRALFALNAKAKDKQPAPVIEPASRPSITEILDPSSPESEI